MGLLDFLGFGRNRAAQQLEAELPYTMEYVVLLEGGLRVKPNDSAFTAAYTGNPTVYAAVQEVAQAVGSLPVVVAQNGEPLESLPPLVQRPNPLQAWAELMQVVTIHLLVYGRGYLRGIGGKKGGIPAELWPLPPTFVEMERGKTLVKPIKGYKWKPGGGKEEPLPEAEVLYLRLPHPTDRIGYLSPLESVMQEFEALEAARAWNRRVIDNNGVTGLIVSVDRDLTDEQEQRLKKLLREQFEGPENARKAKLAWGGVKVQEIGKGAQELDWLNGMKDARIQICNALGVPPEMLGEQSQKTYSNYKEARRAFYRETVLPMGKYILGELTSKFLLGAGMEIMVDEAALEILAEEGVTERLERAWWLTLNEKRIEQGLPPLDVEGADDVWMPAGLVPLGLELPADEAVQEEAAQQVGVNGSGNGNGNNGGGA